MAATANAASLALSQPMQPSMHAAVYDRWFHAADVDHDGRVTGKDAVAFFEKSGLPREILAQVWDLANTHRLGYLDRLSFHKAMDLIAIAQSGQQLSRDLYQHLVDKRAIDIPRMAGFDAEGMPESSEVAKQEKAEKKAASEKHNSTAAFMSPSAIKSSGINKGPVKKPPASAKTCTSVIDGLKHIYFSKVRPLEDVFKFGHFFAPLLTESDFEAKPSVLLLGQYSSGKTTFIKYLLGRDYPGCHIGPEPTTDRFVVVYHGLEERRTPGNTLCVQPDKPFQALNHFGTGFLSRFEGSQCPARLLEEVTIVDTPGVLSGEKQRIERNYNFVDVAKWFASRCDLIFMLFDPNKLDISDEFKAVITAMRGHDDKVRIVLNKADTVDQQELMRVYGALMWSLGKVFKTPEVCRVYTGSFNSNAPIRTDKNPNGKSLFEAEEKELLDSLYAIPERSADRKVNEFVKRLRAAKIHILIMGHLRDKMPAMFGKEKAQKKIIANLTDHFVQIMNMHHLPPGDFPDPEAFAQILSTWDLTKFPKLEKNMIRQLDNALTVDIPALVKLFDNPYI